MSKTYAMPDLDGNGQADTVTVPGGQKSKIVDPSGNTLDYSQIFGNDEEHAPAPKPFEDSKVNKLSDMLYRHGPALSKIFLIVGSAAGTIYNGIKSSHHDTVLIPWLVLTILSFCGLIVEFGFAYGWGVRGSDKLAGKQVKTADNIFKRSAYTMIGDLSLSVAEIAFGIGGIAQVWVGIVQPFVAVHVVMMFYKLKGEHPEAIAHQEDITLKAEARAEAIRDKTETFKLLLDDRKNNRKLERIAMNRRHTHLRKLVKGFWYGRKMKKEANAHVGKSFLGEGLASKLRLLPQSLNLNNRQN